MLQYLNLKRSVILVAASLLLTIKINAQFSISGTVSDEQTGMALQNATLQVAEINRSVITNQHGSFMIGSLKPGSYLFEVSIVGYKTAVQKIAITKDTVINFLLSTAVRELSQVVVTGVTRATELRETPVVIKTVDKKYFAQHTGSNLISALSAIPGISSIGTGPAVSKPVIRGLGYNRVITLNNGIRQEGQQWGDEHGIEMDEFSIDKVEIIKGPGSLLYGSDGVAGVLNFIAPQSPTPGKIRTQLISNYQTNDNLIANSISNAGNINGFQWLGRFTGKLASNYQNKYDGRVYNSGFKEIDGNIFLGLNRKWGHSYLRINSWNNTLNLPEGERNENGQFVYEDASGNEVTATGKGLTGYHTGTPHQQINHLAATLNNYFITGNGSLHADLGFQHNKRKEFGDPANQDQYGLFMDLTTYNYNIRYNLPQMNGWGTSIGIGGMYQLSKNRGTEFLIPEYHLFDAGLFAATEKKLSTRLIFSGGLRFDNRNIKTQSLFLNENGQPVAANTSGANEQFAAFTKNYNGFSGSAGLSFLPNKANTIKLNVSMGYRSPNIAEIATNGVHEGTFRYEIGNPGLKSEHSTQIDLAYFYNADHFTIELSPYANFISNYVFLTRLKNNAGTDSIPDPANPAPAFKYIQGNAMLYGGEVYTDLHPHPLDWLHFENTFSFVRGIQANQPDSTRNLPFIPAPKYTSELRAELKQLGNLFTNSYIKFGVAAWFKQHNFYAANATETATPGYTLWHAGVGTTIPMRNHPDFLQLVFNVENLTDKAYQSHLSRLKYAPENLATGRMGIFDMGRNFSVKAIFTF